MPPDADISLLVKAMAFAARKHKDQRRKDFAASPYINHPVALTAVLVDEAGITDVPTLCAALLHDTLEDTDTSAAELVVQFGEEIGALVIELTDDGALEKAQRKQAQVDRAPGLTRKARAVKLADKICNLRDLSAMPPAGWSLQRQREYYDWARRVIDGLRGDWPDLEALFDREFEGRPGE